LGRVRCPFQWLLVYRRRQLQPQQCWLLFVFDVANVTLGILRLTIRNCHVSQTSFSRTSRLYRRSGTFTSEIDYSNYHPTEVVTSAPSDSKPDMMFLVADDNNNEADLARPAMLQGRTRNGQRFDIGDSAVFVNELL